MELSGRTIVFVNNYAGPSLGGGEVHLINVVGACLAEGMAVHVLCEPGGGLATALDGLGVTVVPFRASPAKLFGVVRDVRSYCGRAGADILHATGFWTGIVSRLAARTTGLALVNSIQCEPDASLAEGGSRLVHALRNVVDRATVGRVDAICAVSAAVAKKLEAIGYPAERIRIVANGVDIGAIRAAAAESDASLPDGFGPGVPVVGMVARLVPVKAADDFLRAAALVLAVRPDTRFVLFGDGPLAGPLKLLARELGLDDRIAFVPGTGTSPMPYLARFDINVLTSRSEGAGLVLLEGMALSKPCVAMNVGGVPEIVLDDETGILVQPRSVSGIAAGILELLADPQRAAAMGAAGRRHVEEEYSIGRMGSLYLQVYRDVLDACGPDDSEVAL